MLHHHGDRVARFVHRRVGDEQGMVPLAPGTLVVLEQGGSALAPGNPDDLRGPRLARERERRFPDRVAVSGSPLVVGDRVHSAAHRLQRRLVDPERPETRLGRERAGVRVLDHQPRNDRSARGDPRGHDGELQRRGQHEALTDASDQRLAALPPGADRCELPFGRGYQPLLFARQIVQQFGAEAEFEGHLRDPVDAHLLRQLVKVDVAASLDRPHQIQPAMAVLVPAMELGLAEFHETLAEDALAGPRPARVQRRQGDRELERRARRVEPRQAPVEQRRHRVGDHGAPRCRRSAP